MAIRAAALLWLILFILPMGFGDIKTTSDTPEFYFTRLEYRSPMRGFGYGRGGSWMTDAWDADLKYMWGIQRMTNVKLSPDPNPVAIMDPDLFKYPYIYAVEVGHMDLSQAEAERIREYLLRGGFWHCDDFWGLQELRSFMQQLRKVFPDRQVEELPLNHEIFHTFFDIDQ